MSRVLITGVSGQDGSYLAERLIGDGWDVHAIVREGRRPDEHEVSTGVTVHAGDLLDTDSLRAVIDSVEPDLIINLAGISSVAQSWTQPELTARVTGLAVSGLLAGAWALQERLGRPVRFVQASSSEMFGAATERPQTENTPLNPYLPTVRPRPTLTTLWAYIAAGTSSRRRRFSTTMSRPVDRRPL